MNRKTAPTIKELTQTYGARNLVFVMDVDCFDEVGMAMGAMIGIGLTEPGKNTHRVAMIARERFHRLDENYQIELQGFDQGDLSIPFQSYHIGDFESMIRNGHVNVYVETPDGFMPVYQCVQECFTASEAKTLSCVQNNFFLRVTHDFIRD